MKLEFIQQEGDNGTCDCIFNGKRIDSCDMNYEKKFTQAHVVLASLYKTLKSKDIEVIVQPHPKGVKTYPIDQIIGMANVLTNDNFESPYGHVRTYNL